MSRAIRIEEPYVHNPYMSQYSKEEAKRSLPQDTMRLSLFGKVQFFAFPTHALERTRLRSEAPPLEERPAELKQLFFGQLPYKVPDSQIVWLVEEVAKRSVLYIERVMQEKSRKGCMQVFVDEADVDDIVRTLDRRVLFDKTGVWYAADDYELRALEEHCSNEANRFKGFPFRMMVVERSTSTYVRRRKTAQRSGSSTPPPSEPVNPADETFDDCEESVVDGGEAYDCAPYYGEPAYTQCTCPDCMPPQSYGPYSSYTPQVYPYPYQYGSYPYYTY